MNHNVAFDVHGAAFTTEVGDEIGGFYGNLAIGSTGTTEDIERASKTFRISASRAMDSGSKAPAFRSPATSRPETRRMRVCVLHARSQSKEA